jgi:hypothetical protein
MNPYTAYQSGTDLHVEHWRPASPPMQAGGGIAASSTGRVGGVGQTTWEIKNVG